VAKGASIDEYESKIAEWSYAAIQEMSRYSERSQQSADFRFGVSDLGWCAEKSRRMLDRQVPEDEELLTAWLGTAIGDHFEEAVKRKDPSAIIQSEVTITLHGEERTYELTGHPDIILPAENLLLDGKTKFGLSTIEKTGPSLNQQFQRHVYAKAAFEAGMFECDSLDDVKVGNVWIDRSGQEKRVHVDIEPFNEEYVRHAGEWLDSVVYAYLHGEEAEKQPPREMCAVTCGFFRVCRAYDTDVEGLLTDPEVLTSVDMIAEARKLEATARKMKAEAQANLKGITGSTGRFSVRWIHVNESEIKPGIRRAHDKLEVREIKS
jgi:hypothetical protein